MAKLTLLEIVQDILNDLEDDEVNSINDSVSAIEVANIVKSTYYNIIDGKEWPHLNTLFQFTALGDTALPNYLQIPDTIASIKWVKYNVRSVTDTKDRYREIKWLDPYEFIEYVNKRASDNSNIQVVTDSSGVLLNIRNDKAPEYFTSFDDEYIVFDSFDNGVDTTLQESKTNGFGVRNPTFTISDSFTPDLPIQAFTYLLNEAKATAFIILKQTANPKAEQHSTSQRRKMSLEKWKIQRGITVPSYGRK